MAIRVLREARDDLRDAARFYRSIPPPRVGRALAERVIQEFKAALATVDAMPLSRPEHPEMPGVRFVLFPKLPYLAFYLVDRGDVVVLSVDHDASDYAAGVLKRAHSAR